VSQITGISGINSPLIGFVAGYQSFLFTVGGYDMKGTVKFFNNTKGWGFITGEDGQEVFVHFSGLNMEGYKTLEEGQTVEYEVSDGQKGPQAVNVTVVK